MDQPEEMNKFDLMMDTLWWMVQNYLWKSEQQYWENIFEDQANKNFKNKTKLTEELKEEFLKKIENTDGTIDLR
jgi:hypothetical protein